MVGLFGRNLVFCVALVAGHALSAQEQPSNSSGLTQPTDGAEINPADTVPSLEPAVLHASASERVPLPEEIDLDQLLKDFSLPGIVAAAFTLDGPIQVSAAGIRTVGSDEPITVDDPMHIGSVTKSFCATIIGQLVDEGKLTFRTTLGEVFSDDTTVTDSAWAAITIDDLMHHLSNAPANAAWNSYDVEDPIVDQRRKVLRWLCGLDRQPTPSGSEQSFTYSNVGYTILGHVAERIDGRDWEVIVRERIFQPLGMASCGFGAPDIGDSGEEAPTGHTNWFFQRTKTITDNPPVMSPAGRIHLPIPELVKFLRVHLAEANETLGLESATMQHLHEPIGSDQYAGGWIVLDRSWSSGKILFHNGTNTFWYIAVFLAPQEKRGYVAATNVFSSQAQAGVDKAISEMIQSDLKADVSTKKHSN
jgi:CubicO group peptidase (beta-lactamase class C family)